MATLFGWGARKESAVETTAPTPPADQVCTSIVLPKFLTGLSQVKTPSILDLGPVVGSNVAFLGDHLGCKLVIGDLHRDLDTALRIFDALYHCGCFWNCFSGRGEHLQHLVLCFTNLVLRARNGRLSSFVGRL